MTIKQIRSSIFGFKMMLPEMEAFLKDVNEKTENKDMAINVLEDAILEIDEICDELILKTSTLYYDECVESLKPPVKL